MGLSERIRLYLENSPQAQVIFQKSTPAIFFSLLTGSIAVIGILAKIFSYDKTIALWLSHAVATDPATKAPELKLWFVPVLFFILAIAVGLVLMVIWTIKRHYTEAGEQVALNELMSAVRQIRDQAKQTKIKAWDSLTFIYLINKDFSGSQTRVAVMKAVDQPVHFWESINAVEDEADPVESLSAVNYRVRDLSSPLRNIVYLPSENYKRIKKACLFFLPPIQPGESRRFEISFQWPGMFKRLRKNAEDVEFTTTTREVLSLYRVEVYLQEGTGLALHCTITGDQYPNQTLTAAPCQVNGWRGNGYIYEVKDIPAGNLHLILKAQLKN
jgi:hypothetical protein